MDKVNISYLELTKNKKDINTKEVEKWKNIILTYINTEINKLIEYILKNKKIDIINENNNKKEIKIESKSQIIFLHLKIYKKKIRKLQ